MTETDLHSVLRSIELFHGLTREQIAAVGALCEPLVFERQQVIIEQGAPGDSMYIIAEGQVEVSARDTQGRTRTRLYLGRGQIVGEYALLDGGTRSATISADQDGTVLYRIERAPFQALCERDPRLGYQVMRNLALDLAFKARHHGAEGD